MNCYIEENRLRLTEIKNFNIRHILDCGQVFRFAHFDTHSTVIAGAHKADIYTESGQVVIECDDPMFFYDYFDLDTDYGFIINEVAINPVMKRATEAGSGIRILRGGLRETIISFIISSNNNIGRIKGSIEKIARALGRDMGGYYAFPDIEVIAQANEEFFYSCGCGYRSKYIKNTAKILADTDILKHLTRTDTDSARKILCELQGIGGKVADCILLFGLRRMDVFPVDTWITKVYKEDFLGAEDNPQKIREFFINKFGKYSGYAQQYLFYYKREQKYK